MSPSLLTTILELLLNYLVSLSLPHSAAPIEDLAAALEDEHDIKRDISRQVMSWFGELDGGLWSMDVKATVKEVGVGILRAYKVRSQAIYLFPKFLMRSCRTTPSRRTNFCRNGVRPSGTRSRRTSTSRYSLYVL